MTETVPVTVVEDGTETTIEIERGTVLRDVLLEREFPVYGTVSKYANCGGRGLCGTCGVRLLDADGPATVPEPTHWHDRAAARYGYPRLSCCIEVTEPMTVELIDKYIWGQVIPRFSR